MTPDRTRAEVGANDWLQRIAERASAEAGGKLPAQALVGFVAALSQVISRGRLTADELQTCREVGRDAVGSGIPLPSVVDAFLSAARLLWMQLPELERSRRGNVSTQQVMRTGEVVLQAADDALAAVAQGYADAGRALVQQEESLRRDVIDALLEGRGDVADLVVRGDRFGIRLGVPHLVAVARSAQSVAAGASAHFGVDEALRRQLGMQSLTVVKAGRLVIILTAGGQGVGHTGGLEQLAAELAAAVGRAIGAPGPVPLALGRVHAGPTGIALSYREAAETLDLALQLRWEHTAVTADQVAVYRVLLRDMDAIRRLVVTVLSPLTEARDGPEPLLETLNAFFAAGAVATETARRMHLSVRAVTYRLARIHALTGYNPNDPADWLALQVAAVGARLLPWPEGQRE